MTLTIYNPEKSLFHQMDGFWLLFLGVGQLIGISAGLIVGTICSLTYLFAVKGKTDETV